MALSSALHVNEKYPYFHAAMLLGIGWSSSCLFPALRAVWLIGNKLFKYQPPDHYWSRQEPHLHPGCHLHVNECYRCHLGAEQNGIQCPNGCWATQTISKSNSTYHGTQRQWVADHFDPSVSVSSCFGCWTVKSIESGLIATFPNLNVVLHSISFFTSCTWFTRTTSCTSSSMSRTASWIFMFLLDLLYFCLDVRNTAPRYLSLLFCQMSFSMVVEVLIDFDWWWCDSGSWSNGGTWKTNLWHRVMVEKGRRNT